jgi:Uma2 family endonuclease
MSVVLEKPKVTPEELLRLPKDRRYELVDGELVEKPMSAISAVIGARILSRISGFVEERNLGAVLNADASYCCFPHAPDRVRRPDVSFIRRERLGPEVWSKGHIPIAPDLVVEIASPSDLVEVLEARVEDYLEAGTPLVWVVYPATRTVRVQRGDRTGLSLKLDGELDGEQVLPGFRLPVREIFRPLEQLPQKTAEKA